ncbi:hypothetical protein ARMGADRAFT_1094040 [Armillaria gallica]|uniref:Uncharacterized protein n=1 Tax=Armillaria gallica TaxID=47427 RepID=A0A2H3EXA2_ARMGA|nr:hypothetical protein ARMGADRAFT_1094040 [Armillaria gallica]
MKRPLCIHIVMDLQSSKKMVPFCSLPWWNTLLVTGQKLTLRHLCGGHLSETLWMKERCDILKNAVATVVCEHLERSNSGKMISAWEFQNSRRQGS